MDYKEIIERELERLCAVKGSQNNTIDLNAYGVGVLDGINSPLAKQITEIEKLEAKIEAYKEVALISYCSEVLSEILYPEIKNLEQLRDKLINELT